MFMTLDVLDEDGKHMFFCVFGQTQKHVFFECFGVSLCILDGQCFSVFLVWPRPPENTYWRAEAKGALSTQGVHSRSRNPYNVYVSTFGSLGAQAQNLIKDIQARLAKNGFFFATFFSIGTYNKRLLRQKTGGACLYMPQDDH